MPPILKCMVAARPATGATTATAAAAAATTTTFESGQVWLGHPLVFLTNQCTRIYKVFAFSHLF